MYPTKNDTQKSRPLAPWQRFGCSTRLLHHPALLQQTNNHPKKRPQPKQLKRLKVRRTIKSAMNHSEPSSCMSHEHWFVDGMLNDLEIHRSIATLTCPCTKLRWSLRFVWASSQNGDVLAKTSLLVWKADTISFLWNALKPGDECWGLGHSNTSHNNLEFQNLTQAACVIQLG